MSMGNRRSVVRAGGKVWPSSSGRTAGDQGRSLLPSRMTQVRILPVPTRLPLLLLALVVGCGPSQLSECHAGWRESQEWAVEAQELAKECVASLRECVEQGNQPDRHQLWTPHERPPADLGGYQAWLDSGGEHDLDGSVLR